MSTKIRKHTDFKKIVRFKRKKRIRSSVIGSESKPRLCIFKSNAHFYAQIIDDSSGRTLVAVSSNDKASKLKANLEGTKELGRLLADKALRVKVGSVVFDRSGYLYHGKVQAFADAARSAGLKF